MTTKDGGEQAEHGQAALGRHAVSSADGLSTRHDDAGDVMAALRDVLSVAKEETPAGDDALWVLADLLEPINPNMVGSDLVLADAALLLFGEVEFGPTNRALLWLRYAQRVTADLLKPSAARTRAANTAMARLCCRLGRYEEAASAWATVASGLAEAGRWREADVFHVKQAMCLYGTGRCVDAVTLVRQAWQRWKADPGGRVIGAKSLIVCAEMLRICCRRDEARTVWSELTDWFGAEGWFSQEWIEMEMSFYRGPVNARTHRRVCAFRMSGAVTTDRRVPVPRPPAASTREAAR